MANKIIVNGVDVSGCVHAYTDKYNDLCCSRAACKDRPCDPSRIMCSCYIKYLEVIRKEKEQECEGT